MSGLPSTVGTPESEKTRQQVPGVGHRTSWFPGAQTTEAPGDFRIGAWGPGIVTGNPCKNGPLNRYLKKTKRQDRIGIGSIEVEVYYI